MSFLIYVEGYSEENLVKAILHSRGLPYSDDAITITSRDDTIYLKNCEGDSAIIPSIGEDLHLLQQVQDKTIIIIQDILNSVCYSKFKESIRIELQSNNITLPFRIINSRPKIEAHYLENIEILKRSILGYINQKKGLINTSFDRIDPKGKFDPTDYNSIKKVLAENNTAFLKRDFSEKFFNSLVKFDQDITLTLRLKSFL